MTKARGLASSLEGWSMIIMVGSMKAGRHGMVLEHGYELTSDPQVIGRESKTRPGVGL